MITKKGQRWEGKEVGGGRVFNDFLNQEKEPVPTIYLRIGLFSRAGRLKRNFVWSLLHSRVRHMKELRTLRRGQKVSLFG